jgi:DNA-directed RNA polymerase specialized sigma subunit
MGMSQKNIADEFGVSQMYISRLEKKIYHKMRKKLESN